MATNPNSNIAGDHAGLVCIQLAPEEHAAKQPYLRFDLVTLPDGPFRQRGIYGKSGDILPRRFMHVQPEMAADMVRRETDYPGVFHFSDLRRSAEGSLYAIKRGKGALPPGWSHHNFGGAEDDDLKGKRARLRDFGIVEMGTRTWKATYDEIQRRYNFLCHRKDHKLHRLSVGSSEAWHFGHGLNPFDREDERTRYRATQRWIDERYGNWWRKQMTSKHVQLALMKLGLYGGDIDGIIGPLSREAILAFQRTWKLLSLRNWHKRGQRGQADINTRRVLAFISADLQTVDRRTGDTG